MAVTKIEWCDRVWNPVIGCSKISAGCANCYAQPMAGRLKAMGNIAYRDVVDGSGPRATWNGQIAMNESTIDAPLRWRKPRRIFVNSMGDLFHENCPMELIERVYSVIARCPQHTFMVLTKRPHRINEFYRQRFRDIHKPWPLPNLWLGTSVEDQASADERIPHLFTTPAELRFLSIEPLLGPVVIKDVHGADWVIVGGESGPHARPMNPDWVRSIRDQCRKADVPFFFKQWGEWIPTLGQANGLRIREHRDVDFEDMARVGKLAAGHLLDGVEYREIPEVKK